SRPTLVLRGSDQVEYEYNLHGRTLQITGLPGAQTITTISYDRMGRVLTEQNSPNNRVQHEYDQSGNETAITVQTKRTYRAQLEVQQTGWLDAVTRYEYDPLNRRIKQTVVGDYLDDLETAHDAVTLYAYDTLGRLVSKTDANSEDSPTVDDRRVGIAND